MTMITPDVTNVTNTINQGDHERCSHIVPPEPGRSAAAIITEARVYGTPVIALCGRRWVPERDPENFPVCQGCIDEFEKIMGRPWTGRR